MEHEESVDCWCCPIVERIIDDAGEVVEFIIHGTQGDEN